MESDEKPILEGQIEKKPQKGWKAPPEIEDIAMLIIKEAGVLPLKVRANDRAIEEAYHKGYLLYQAGRYKAAKNVFSILGKARPQNQKYMLGIGACCHMLKEYDNAIVYYGVCGMLDPDNPMPLYYLADCYTKIFQPFGALVSLDMAITKCRNQPKYAVLKDRMSMMLQQIKKELEEKKAQGATSFIGKAA